MIHPSAIVDDGAVIGEGTKIWHFCHIFGSVSIGSNCTIGQNVMIGPNVKIGNGCKIQNNVSIYRGVELDDDVFCGPSCVFTNVKRPRAHLKAGMFAATIVKRGVTIGANATIICGNEIGEYAMIAAGSVITRYVSPYALVSGVPARRIGTVDKDGEPVYGKFDIWE
jgi:UDP-2-acetamido-3-amino-2,3-dideoxy-glucuronate N-acetyltransferase